MASLQHHMSRIVDQAFDAYVQWRTGKPMTAPAATSVHPIAGHMDLLSERSAETFTRLTRTYGDTVRIRLGSDIVHFFNHPDDVQYILQTHHRNFNKQTRGYLKMQRVMGLGLVTSDGDFWLRQRRIAQPAFHRRRIAGFANHMVTSGQKLVERWRPLAARAAQLDAMQEMMALTLEIAASTLFSFAVGSAETQAVSDALEVILEEVDHRITSLSMDLVGEWRGHPRNRRYLDAIAVLDQLVYGVIEARRRDGTEGDDLLSMLLQARDEETGEGMSDQQLRDECLTLLLAGHETTAVALSWTWYLLSTHPAVARRLYEEIDQVLGDRPPSLDDIPNMPWTTQIIQESMRLYPPVWFISRGVEQDDVIGGHHVPAGSFVFVQSYSVHRHPEFWDNPEGFDPERFAPGRDIHRFAYIPFVRGPRQCIGNNFAMMELQLLLPLIAQHYRLDLVPGTVVTAEPSITLRPRDGVPVVLRPRH